MLWPYALLMLASLAALAAGRKRRAAYLLGFSLMMILLWSACGGGGGMVVQTTPGTPSGTYALSVTGTVTSAATSNKLTHNLPLTLTVN
jgi:hypothetical protein